MLPKKNRLSKQRDFLALKKTGKRVYNTEFKITQQKNNLEASRFAVVISAKISKKAVVRNKMRRQCYEVIRLHLDKIKKGVDCLIWVNQKALDLGYNQLEKSLLTLFKKVGLYNEIF